MKQLARLSFVFLLALASCQQGPDSTSSSAKEKADTIVEAPCAYTETDSVLARQHLRGEWELAGIKTNAMGSKPDEFLTGAKIGTPKTLTFYPNQEFEVTLNGQPQGGRQKYVLDGQSLTPLAYQFWFCGESTLILSNIAADGPTEVFIKK